MEERQVADYYLQDEYLFTLGKVNYKRAKDPLRLHCHEECMEFVFLERGCQTYQVEEQEYTIRGGDIFVSYPWEVHGSGGNPEEKNIFYYLIINLEKVCKSGVGCMEAESTYYLNAFSDKNKRIYKAPEWFGKVFADLLRSCLEKSPMRDTQVRNMISILLTAIAELPAAEKKRKKDEGLDKALDYINEHVKDDLEVQRLADLCGLSVSRFQNYFSQQIGIPPREYILREKIKYCQKEMIYSKKNITEIALEYGFSSSQYFSTVFKRYCCMTPSEYRQRSMFKGE